MSLVTVLGFVAYATVVCATPSEAHRRSHARSHLKARSPAGSNSSLCVSECKVAVPDVTQYEWQPLPAASTRVVETVTIIVDPQNPAARSTAVTKNYPPDDPDGSKNGRLVNDGVAYTTLALPGTVVSVQFPTPVTVIPTIVTQIGDLKPGSVGPGCTAAPVFEKTLKLASGAAPVKFGSNPALAANPDKENWHLVPRVSPENPLDWRTLFAKDPVLDTCHLFAKRPAVEIAAAVVAGSVINAPAVKYVTTTITSTKAGTAATPAAEPAPAPPAPIAHQQVEAAPSASRTPALDAGVQKPERPVDSPSTPPQDPIVAGPVPQTPAPEHHHDSSPDQPPAAPAPAPAAPASPAVDPTTVHPFGFHTNPGPPPAAAPPAGLESHPGVHTNPGPPPGVVAPLPAGGVLADSIIHADPSFATPASPAPASDNHAQHGAPAAAAAPPMAGMAGMAGMDHAQSGASAGSGGASPSGHHADSVPGGLVDPEDLPDAPTGMNEDEAEHEAEFGSSHGLDINDHGGMFMAPMSAGSAPAGGDAHSAHVAATGASDTEMHMSSGDSTSEAHGHSGSWSGVATDDMAGMDMSSSTDQLTPASAPGHQHGQAGAGNTPDTAVSSSSDPNTGVLTVVPGPASAAKSAPLTAYEGSAAARAPSGMAVGVALVAGLLGVIAGL